MIYNGDIEKLMPILEDFASKASFILEIGPAQGNGSTIAFERGLEKSEEKDKLFISVDIRDYMEVKPQSKYWHLVLGDSTDRETVKKVRAISGRRKADIIFIDTHHTYEQMRKELSLWPNLSHEDTIFLFHDTWMMGEYNPMTDAIKEFAHANEAIYEDITKDSHGLGAMYL